MPRPKKLRFICFDPEVTYFKPIGIPKGFLEEISLEKDELEAVRLADLQGLYHEEAAKVMNISRQTFGNILNSAHKKIADSLVNGKILKIEGGKVSLKEFEKCSPNNFLCHQQDKKKRCEE
ncbi:MAG: DUF134 domain-containing protein [bacterium]|nr:DUF134 domain-containing protein [bacterium]